MTVPELRIRTLNGGSVREDGDWVLYWLNGFRRLEWNFALERAVEQANRLERPLVVLEALRTGYRWASDRLHRFILEGMADHLDAVSSTRAVYFPYVEREEGAGSGLLEALAERAALVVTDDYPAFFLPRMVQAAADRIDVSMEAVDSNGLLPMRAADKVFARAYDFRRWLQKNLAPHLQEMPAPSPLEDLDVDGRRSSRVREGLERIAERWTLADESLFDRLDELLAELPIDHDVAPIDERGGRRSGRARLESFVEDRLDRYHEHRNDVVEGAASGLSPWLHFGHVSSHEILAALAEREGWTPLQLPEGGSGSREGWWGMSPGAEAFLDELVTWRELGFNMASKRDDYDTLEAIPDWAKKTIAEHRDDEREHLYDLEVLENAETHDEVWNAAQRELVETGRIHNYLRMLWGKKIYQWSASAEDAVDVMIELNNKYAVDGRDPNSYSGIFWCLGRYDRAWGPERPVFGKLRYMTSESTRRKLDLEPYLERYGD